ncbi:16S RNA methylase [Lactobacillus selangorensis]|uniref:16S RNA methylase n=1 Tax=Lactobacillus selangorensis TaxID=81857 RepID=A0A0R2FFR8_9LACO|nr:class I SAM-dependent methyltransferase [Lactobacillus selangorensis]KRN27411.1 16S RNA methylase [Lactobacillus selangorensis]KRN31392.1 16S RNA methylase [Lactobacillus selangorensis]
MTNYYFSAHPDVQHDEHEWNYTLLGEPMRFVTDNGVFSKHTVDYGTRVLLSTFNDADYAAGEFLDIGCGYGPIGLTLAKKAPERHVDMVDVNELALSLAQKSAKLNQIENVSIFVSDAYAQITKQYAAIWSNPPVRAGKEVVTEILTGAKDHLLPGGKLTIVLQKKQGAPSAKKTMQATYGNVKTLKKDKGYYILQSQYNA